MGQRLFLICLRQVSNEGIQTSIIHIPPCSQKIIDNENPDFLRVWLRCEMRLLGCHGNNNCFCFHCNHGHYLNFHCYQFKSWHNVRTILRSICRIVETGKINPSNTRDNSLSCLGKSTSIKRGGFKLVERYISLIIKDF